MSRPRSIEPEELIARMLRVFRTNGYEGTSLSLLSKETGLANAALYHRYPGGKREMAEAVLGDLRTWTRSHVLAALRAPGEPVDVLRAMCAALDELYDSGHGACLIGMFASGESLEQFGETLAAAFTDLMGAIADVLIRAGLPERVARERAEDTVIRIQGSLVVCRALGSAEPFTRTLDRLPRQLLEPCDDTESAT